MLYTRLIPLTFAGELVLLPYIKSDLQLACNGFADAFDTAGMKIKYADSVCYKDFINWVSILRSQLKC